MSSKGALLDRRDEVSSGRPSSAHKQHFVVLDALRGVAALAVMQYHTNDWFGLNLFPHGYLAVDFFFILSGFVLTFAYQEKLRAGWATTSFLKTRLVRLYPLYFLGLILGFVMRYLPRVVPGNAVSRGHFAEALVLGLFLLPLPKAVPHLNYTLFPFNYPAWSLFYEFVANLVHVFLFRRGALGPVAATVAVSGAGFLGATFYYGTVGFGLIPPQIVAGLFRVIFSYSVGVLLFLLWQAKPVPFRMPALVAVASLVGALAVRLTGRSAVFYDVGVIFVFFPVVLYLNASAKVSDRFLPLAKLLGQASYAVYMLHVPLSEAFEVAYGHVMRHNIHRDVPWSGIVYAAVVVMAAILVDRVYDVPVRDWLRRRVLARYPAGAYPRDPL